MSKRQDYIDQYASAAMKQMKRYGIPASVILAQGIIESGNGQSQLSQLYNNHFGIKATQKWLDGGGQYAVYTDDRPNEKFCAYATVAESYEHHSQFLKENSRYTSLFQLSPDDHEGWANGLQQAGYASSRSYAQTLEAVIKANGLDKYDRQVMQEMQGKEFGITANPMVAQAVSQNETSTRHYAFPIDSKEFMLVTSPFGMRTDPMDHSKQQNHKGVDIRADHVPLKATEDGGKVIAVCKDAGTTGGRSVTVEYDREDGSKVRVFCCHLDKVDVKVGDVVSAGQQLGITGNTGTRTTGPHLHLGVKQVSADGEVRDIDPASYFADIAVKGGIQQAVMYNGQNLLDKYTTPEQRQPLVTDENRQHDDIVAQEDPQQMDPQDWMKKLLTSEDAGASMSADPIMDMIVSLFGSLMALALQIDNRCQEDKMQMATDVALDRRIDLTGLVAGVKDCVLSWPQDGKPQLSMTVGDKTITHNLTEAETSNLNAVLSDSNRSDTEKQQRLVSLVNQVVIQQQVSNNYNEQIGQGESQGLQR